ncbi:hypothetical protein COY87_05770 [Candidatus Roizmanbacteria bacterium CG_4_10_14_0_8_um_filter_33_9]|uniref:Large ribosomal subunit protein uL29 n=1 Tax=Candidatus Roizmanbacteria bacterium CG_4_10_14_0_8_um_filter_33_9 TaxID=1974826 RepID=A0A2M7QGQ7_9BACT|nr:MAG: hypothetical protein COY87_05770 [Candidatus Roizmanbacteria bacterium CG_4_10_14_0_8_um_filter_33_9]
MKIKLEDYKTKSKEELEKEINKLREEIAKDSIEFTVTLPKNTNLVFQKKKKLAVLLTLQKQKSNQKK